MSARNKENRFKTPVFWSKDGVESGIKQIYTPGLILEQPKIEEEQAMVRMPANLRKPAVPIVSGRNVPSSLQPAITKPQTQKHKATSKTKTRPDRTRHTEERDSLFTEEAVARVNSQSLTAPGLKDLRPEDKKRVANLIRELAKAGEEREVAFTQLQQERSAFQQRLDSLQEEYNGVLNERKTLQDRFLECQGLLEKYKLKQSTPPPKTDQTLNESMKVLSTGSPLHRSCIDTPSHSDALEQKPSQTQSLSGSTSQQSLEQSWTSLPQKTARSNSETGLVNQTLTYELETVHRLYQKEYELQLQLQQQQVELERQQMHLQNQLQQLNNILQKPQSPQVTQEQQVQLSRTFEEQIKELFRQVAKVLPVSEDLVEQPGNSSPPKVVQNELQHSQRQVREAQTQSSPQLLSSNKVPYEIQIPIPTPAPTPQPPPSHLDLSPTLIPSPTTDACHASLLREAESRESYSQALSDYISQEKPARTKLDTRTSFRDSMEYKERLLQNKENEVEQMLYKTKDQPARENYPVSIMKPTKQHFDNEAAAFKHRRPMYAKEPSNLMFSERTPSRPMTSMGYGHRTSMLDDEDGGYHRYKENLFPDQERGSLYQPGLPSHSQLTRPKTAPRNPYKGLGENPEMYNNHSTRSRPLRYNYELHEDQYEQEYPPRYTENSNRLSPESRETHIRYPFDHKDGYQSYQMRSDYQEFPAESKLREDLQIRPSDEIYPSSLIDIVEGLENAPTSDYISLNKLKPTYRNFDTNHVNWNYEDPDPDCEERTVMDEIFFSTLSDS